MARISQFSDETILKKIEDMEKNGEKPSLIKLSELFPVNRNRLHNLLSGHQKKRLQLPQIALKVPPAVLTAIQNALETERENAGKKLQKELDEAIQRGDDVAKLLQEAEFEIERCRQELVKAIESQKAAENERMLIEGKLLEAQRITDEVRKELSVSESKATAVEERAKVAENRLSEAEKRAEEAERQVEEVQKMLEASNESAKKEVEARERAELRADRLEERATIREKEAATAARDAEVARKEAEAALSKCTTEQEKAIQAEERAKRAEDRTDHLLERIAASEMRADKAQERADKAEEKNNAKTREIELLQIKLEEVQTALAEQRKIKEGEAEIKT